jgi:hypothetical protein
MRLGILQKHSNRDSPVPPRKFKLRRIQGHQAIDVMYENQGCAWWSVLIDAGADPAVMINIDPPLRRAWCVSTDRFSDWVFTQIFDHIHWHDELMYGEIYPPLEPTDLSFLRNAFKEEPTTTNRSGCPYLPVLRWLVPNRDLDHGGTGRLVCFSG